MVRSSGDGWLNGRGRTASAIVPFEFQKRRRLHETRHVTLEIHRGAPLERQTAYTAPQIYSNGHTSYRIQFGLLKFPVLVGSSVFEVDRNLSQPRR